jgi:hypothetical protein
MRISLRTGVLLKYSIRQTIINIWQSIKQTFIIIIMQHRSCKIDNDSQVAIVGGGPAGSFFALYLRHFARLQGVDPYITIYQDRSFDALGPKGCKGCAGIISLSLIKDMAELSISPPPEVIQSTIDRFAVHTPYASIDISNPDKDIKIMSVYRGGGPRISHYEKNISFDGWLLRQAENNGIEVKSEKVARIWTGATAGLEAAGKRIDYDLLAPESTPKRSLLTARPTGRPEPTSWP